MTAAGEVRPADAGMAVVEGVFRMHERLRTDVSAALAHLQLSHTLADALWALDPRHGPLPRRVLAERLHCDPSNVTFLADRLVERGLLRRVGLPEDRRVRALELTEAGRDVRDHLAQAMGEALRRLGLTDEQQRALASLLGAANVKGGETDAPRFVRWPPT